MRKSFFKKLTIALLLLLWVGWAGFVYANPSEWLDATAFFIMLTLVFSWRAYAASKAAEREKGFANEDGTWPESVTPPKSMGSEDTKGRK